MRIDHVSDGLTIDRVDELHRKEASTGSDRLVASEPHSGLGRLERLGRSRAATRAQHRLAQAAGEEFAGYS